MDYSQFTIKDYKYWTVQIHGNQGYLGRCVVWCKREDALDLTDATPEEQKELFQILVDLKTAATKCFQPDWFNYSFLGNAEKHLHCHFVPRYNGKREFMSLTFEDKLWGSNYQMDTNFVTPPELLETIKVKLKEALA